ncbi:DNA-binding response OmpR family regulator [Ereboglobus sp. PH5-10]|uniref:response regulator transcription factor n=1 Tax=Ereboglobus sp. PH5-10 TaxID=2940629 RepID=UPI002405B57B|nr:response regulator transcription factor [Ereboglobus sp. PH5-10]MDF9828104.1 DNA-binding response OmpR family regulator [Ereboglobus sp. PH5-10]
MNNINNGAVLVAEDDLNLGLFWEEWLTRAGYTVTRTTNKADALTAFELGRFALVVLDMQMPAARGRGVNNKAGLLAAREMRRLDPDVPVLFLTAGNDEEIEADALELPGHGKTGFTRKPCGMKAFQLRAREMARNNQFPFGPRAVINTSTHTATITGAKESKRLSPQVLDLAVVFARNKDVSLSRAELVRQWGWDEASLDECIRKLRDAVNDADRTTIKTIHGTGYIYQS